MALVKNTACLIVPMLSCSVVHAWNATGHMIAAHLAWQKLTTDQQSKAVEILRLHPHYDEYLSAARSPGFSEDEWVFLRAATWPDWVRTHHKRDYHHPEWHYVNLPFVPPGSRVDASAQMPPEGQQNIIRQLGAAIKKVRGGGREEKAIYLCWVLHLVGDLHQPLHCTALFSEKFPNGDQGGNAAYVRMKPNSRKSKLHPIWDGLLDHGTNRPAIDRVTKQVHNLLKENPDLIKDDLANNTTVESWARESFGVAKWDAYLNGDLPIGTRSDDADDIGVAPKSYGPRAGHVARVQIAKAGARLVNMLEDLLK